MRKKIVLRITLHKHFLLMKGLFELLTEKKWMLQPEFVHGIRKALETNLNTHTAFSKPERTCGFVTAQGRDGEIFYPADFQISEDGNQVRGHWELEGGLQNFPFVSVLTVDGPITRNGGGCSYGSVDFRDMMMRAADHPLCRGHVFIINTPGGSAWAKNDFQQAIAYAHERGQYVLAFIDGLCASAGMYLAALCDEVYYMHPENEIGCIGVMAAFYSEVNGSVNQFTNETYHELYDPESFDKNKSFRDIANDGDDKELINELAALGVQFREEVKNAFPDATDEHIHGKIFAAKDVEGILVDGQSTFMETVQRAFALYDGSVSLVDRKALNTDEPSEESETPVGGDIPEEAPKEKTNTNTIDMKNYPLINAVCGLKEGEIVVNEEGAFMNAALLDKLEYVLNADLETANELKELRKRAESESNSLTESAEKLTKLQASHDDLQKEHADAIAKKDEQISALTEANAKAVKELEGMKAALATAEQTISDKDEQIAALSEEPGSEPQSGDAPQNNGEGVKTRTLREFNPSLYKTNAERKAAFEKFMRGE